MKIFIIGGVTVTSDLERYQEDLKVLRAVMRPLGQEIVSRGHDLLVCSPFEGSADLEVAFGAVLSKDNVTSSSIEYHYPDSEKIRAKVLELRDEIGVENFHLFPHLTLDESQEGLTYAWLLAQLRALDRSHVVITIGGKPNGSASLLLLLAESRRHIVLPLTCLEGAASQAFQRKRYELIDVLGEKSIHLLGSQDAIQILQLLEQLASASGRQIQRKKQNPTRFFISYARSRPSDADFVEMTLQRRNYSVFRDERNFGAGQSLPTEISEYIHSSDVFIALWSQEYACSPWCFDELDLALKLKQEKGLSLWILCLDSTRIVPPAARNLLNYPVNTRKELEGQIVALLESL